MQIQESSPSRRRSGLAALQEHNFRLWFVTQGISMVGYFAQAIAQGLLVLELTGSGATLGLVTALQFLPTLALGAWAGVLSDRSPKWLLMLVTQGIGMLIAVLQGWLVVADEMTSSRVIACAAVAGAVWAFDQPARRAIVTELVADTAAMSAVNLNGALINCAKVLGPTVAGLLIAAGGLGWCFLFNAGTSVVGIIGLLRMDRLAMNVGPLVERRRGQIAEGVRYVQRDPNLHVPIALMGVVTTACFNWNVLLPLLVKIELDSSSSAYTAVFATMSCGAVGGSLWLAVRPEPQQVLLGRLAVAVGLSLALLSVSSSLLVAAVAAPLVGASTVAFLNATIAVVQIRADPAIRGRVMSLLSVVLLGALGLGGLGSGWLGDRLGARQSFAIGSLVALLVGAGTQNRLRSNDRATET